MGKLKLAAAVTIVLGLSAIGIGARRRPAAWRESEHGDSPGHDGRAGITEDDRDR